MDDFKKLRAMLVYVLESLSLQGRRRLPSQSWCLLAKALAGCIEEILLESKLPSQWDLTPFDERSIGPIDVRLAIFSLNRLMARYSKKED